MLRKSGPAKSILVPRAHNPSGLWQGSRALAGPDLRSMRRVSVSYYQPIRFVRFDEKSVNCGLPVLDKARALDSCHRPEGSWALGTRMNFCATQSCYPRYVFFHQCIPFVHKKSLHSKFTPCHKKCGGRKFLTIANTIKCNARSVQGTIGMYKGFLCPDWRYFRWRGKIN